MLEGSLHAAPQLRRPASAAGRLLARPPQRVPLRHGAPAVVRAAASGDGNKPGGKRKLGQDLDDRIASGEFSDVGSTKERLTRPLRKALAADPIGPGVLLQGLAGTGSGRAAG